MEARIKMLENSVRVLQEANDKQDETALGDLLALTLAIGKLERRVAALEGGTGEKAKDSGGPPPSLEGYIMNLLKNIPR